MSWLAPLGDGTLPLYGSLYIYGTVFCQWFIHTEWYCRAIWFVSTICYCRIRWLTIIKWYSRHYWFILFYCYSRTVWFILIVCYSRTYWFVLLLCYSRLNWLTPAVDTVSCMVHSNKMLLSIFYGSFTSLGTVFFQRLIQLCCYSLFVWFTPHSCYCQLDWFVLCVWHSLLFLTHSPYVILSFLYDSFLLNVTVDTYDSLAKLPSGHLIFLKTNVIIKNFVLYSWNYL